MSIPRRQLGRKRRGASNVRTKRVPGQNNQGFGREASTYICYLLCVDFRGMLDLFPCLALATATSGMSMQDRVSQTLEVLWLLYWLPQPFFVLFILKN